MAPEVGRSIFRNFERTKQTGRRAINLTTLVRFRLKNAIERKTERGCFVIFVEPEAQETNLLLTISSRNGVINFRAEI